MRSTTVTLQKDHIEPDLYVCAALMAVFDLPLLRVEPNGGRRCNFILPYHPDIEEARNRFFAKRLQVDAFTFAAAVREVKRRLHAEGMG